MIIIIICKSIYVSFKLFFSFSLWLLCILFAVHLSLFEVVCRMFEQTYINNDFKQKLWSSSTVPASKSNLNVGAVGGGPSDF